MPSGSNEILHLLIPAFGEDVVALADVIGADASVAGVLTSLAISPD